MATEYNTTIAKLMQDMDTLTNRVSQLTKELNKLKIDDRITLTANPSIAPGIYPKIAYDSNGLVLQGMKLDPSDIPDLSMSQISGLKSTLDNVATSADIKKIITEMKQLVPHRSDSVGTATKVNYDSNGFVVSGSDLSVDDIPTLPMDKVDGLTDLIDIIRSLSDSSLNTKVTVNENITRSGTFTKVSVDSTGRVINGEKLNINDIPSDLICRINSLESSMVNTAPIELVNKLSESMSTKVESVDNISPGTYTKVTINSNGIVIKGDKLGMNDLPELTIDSITGLKGELSKTAKYTDIADLNDSISQVLSTIQTIGDINHIKETLNSKAEADTVSKLVKEVSSIKSSMSSIEESLPSEFILKRLDMIDEKLSTIEGRLAVLEKYSDGEVG